jgi:glycosyltransferase involved in cell wall biosynthesis
MQIFIKKYMKNHFKKSTNAKIKTKMHKVLAFIDWYRPGYKAGGTITAFCNFVNHLNDEIEFNIVTRDCDYTESKSYLNIQSDSWNHINPNENIYYISSKKLSIRTIRSIIKSIPFDTIYINGIYSFYFSILPLLLTTKKNKIIVNPHGMLSEHSFTVKSTKKSLFIWLSKKLKIYKNTLFHVADNNEKEEVSKRIETTNIVVTGHLPKKTVANFTKRIKNKNELNLISITRISPEKNILFALEILNQCYNTNIEFNIYGAIYNENYWLECKKIIDHMPINIKVHYHGSIASNEIENVLKNSHFLFLPSKGENFGHAILEAFMEGCPVIISNQTPWKNLQTLPSNVHNNAISNQFSVGWDLPLDRPDLFIAAIKYCAAMDQNEYDKMSKKAYVYANQIINNDNILSANKALFK